jgi:heme oxygenase (mycobilin-producing)
MTIKVLIKRKVPKERELHILNYINQLRAMATRYPGNVSEEIMWSVEDPEEYIVFSSWRSLSHWKNWRESRERDVIQKKIDELSGVPTRYEVYRYPEISTDEFSEPLM